jgi:hypothetical protein
MSSCDIFFHLTVKTEPRNRDSIRRRLCHWSETFEDGSYSLSIDDSDLEEICAEYNGEGYDTGIEGIQELAGQLCELHNTIAELHTWQDCGYGDYEETFYYGVTAQRRQVHELLYGVKDTLTVALGQMNTIGTPYFRKKDIDALTRALNTVQRIERELA